MNIKRRSFLKALPLVGGGLLVHRTASGEQAGWKPPRWEWKAGKWRYCKDFLFYDRTWEATVAITHHERIAIIRADLFHGPPLNSTAFIGVGPGCLYVCATGSKEAEHGEPLTQVILKECRPSSELLRWCQKTAKQWHPFDQPWCKRVNFYDLFHGDHAVVNAEQRYTYLYGRRD